MDLVDSPENQTFRTEVRQFLKDNWTPGDKSDLPQRTAEFRKRAIERGYMYRSIPRQWGGSEQAPDIFKARIIDEEFQRAKAPSEIRTVGTQMLAPTLLECGEEWQKEQFVRKTLTGEYRWCQGYSEPGAGSDLASLSTRAELVGDEWVINGQKVWTSHARDAHYMFALVRTEPTAPKHHNLSYLLLDVKQPGVSIRPLKQINGGADFNEVFFTDAKTPASWIVGNRGEGWKISRSLLKHERNMLGSVDRSDALFKSLLKLARNAERNGRPAIEDPWVRDRLARLKGYLEVQRFSSYIQLTRETSGGDADLLQKMNKLDQSNFGHGIAELALELLRNDSLLAPNKSADQGNERWMNQYLMSLAAAIAGGTSNIQRNIIAERGLGLPREPQQHAERT